MTPAEGCYTRHTKHASSETGPLVRQHLQVSSLHLMSCSLWIYILLTHETFIADGVEVRRHRTPVCGSQDPQAVGLPAGRGVLQTGAYALSCLWMTANMRIPSAGFLSMCTEYTLLSKVHIGFCYTELLCSVLCCAVLCCDVMECVEVCTGSMAGGPGEGGGAGSEPPYGPQHEGWHDPVTGQLSPLSPCPDCTYHCLCLPASHGSNQILSTGKSR